HLGQVCAVLARGVDVRWRHEARRADGVRDSVRRFGGDEHRHSVDAAERDADRAVDAGCGVADARPIGAEGDRREAGLLAGGNADARQELSRPDRGEVDAEEELLRGHFALSAGSGEAARAFITLIIVWPPASARAPSFAASSSSASPTDVGFAYSTSRSSTRRSYPGLRDGFSVDAVQRFLEPSAGASRAHREDLREHRERRLGRRVRADVETGGPGDAVEVV